MKVELEPEDIMGIAEKIVELLTPRLGNNKQEDFILDKKALAAYIGVNASWVDKNLYMIPHFKIGKYVRFRQSHIDKWIEANKVMPSPYLKMVR